MWLCLVSVPAQAALGSWEGGAERDRQRAQRTQGQSRGPGSVEQRGGREGRWVLGADSPVKSGTAGHTAFVVEVKKHVVVESVVGD